MDNTQIKLSFIKGLKEVVLKEVSQYKYLKLNKESENALYFELFSDLRKLKTLKSATKIHLTREAKNYHPLYVSNHKSILGSLVELVLDVDKDEFKTFRLDCAGADSKESLDIREYIIQTYKLKESDDADLKIHIIKIGELWEIGVEITPRPLSLRDYKVENIKGGLNPTIAYSMNTLVDLFSVKSYLNIFSGSATLLIEAGKLNNKLKLVGFDRDKKTTSLAIQNIKKAKLIKNIELKVFDIFDNPDLGKFDVITSDLPFGMAISKDEDLYVVYRQFVQYCQNILNDGGVMVVYTSEHEIFSKVIKGFDFTITKTLSLKFLTSVDAYLTPKIFVCERK